MSSSDERLVELAELLTKLKHNEENVQKDVLRTKYKTPYQQLKDDIKSKFDQYIAAVEREKDIRMQEEYLKAVSNIIYEFVNTSSYPKAFGTALYKHYDAKEVKELAETMFQEIDNVITIYIIKHTALLWEELCEAKEVETAVPA